MINDKETIDSNETTYSNENKNTTTFKMIDNKETIDSNKGTDNSKTKLHKIILQSSKWLMINKRIKNFERGNYKKRYVYLPLGTIENE